MTGQLFLRDTGVKKNGKNVFMVFGVVGLDDAEAISMPNENQYTIKNIELVDPINMKAYARGNSADGLLTSPIWRI
jgi:hypothetical protein